MLAAGLDPALYSYPSRLRKSGMFLRKSRLLITHLLSGRLKGRSGAVPQTHERLPIWIVLLYLKRTLALLATWLAVWQMAQAAAPEIARVYPDFPSASPHLIIGESFSLEDTEVWTWGPQLTRDEILATADKLDTPALLPMQPPEGARRVKPLDVESQVITVPLSGAAVWVKNADGWSKPYRFNVPKPFWISHERIEAGELLHVFGFGLRTREGVNIVLSGGGRHTFCRPTVEARSPRTPDKRLVYFEVPMETEPGNYEIWFHNGMGGRWGWVRAGSVHVMPRRTEKRPVFDIRDFGAKGDDLENDYESIRRAVAAAESAGGVVAFPPGTWRSDTEIIVPRGVEIRGAGWQNTVLEGFYGDIAPDARTSAMLRITSDVTVSGLTFVGCVFKGNKTHNKTMISLPPRPGGERCRDVTVRRCRFQANCNAENSGSEDILTGRPLYRLNVSLRGSHINFLNNDVFGRVSIGGHRVEIIGNKFHGGATILIHNWVTDSLLDANYFVDSPGRICFYPRRHCYIRYNEAHQSFRGTWANADEIYLTHGGAPQTTGHPTSATSTTLTDTRQAWQPGELKDATLLITHGRGFGQYRRIIDNSKDTLTLERPLRVIPDEDSEYSAGMKYMESCYYANLNNTPNRLSLWLDCVGCVVEYQRDVYAGGLDVWARDHSNTAAEDGKRELQRFYPSFYNMFLNCWLDGSRAMLWSDISTDRAFEGPLLFGNYIFGNKLRSSHMRRTGFAMGRPSQGAIPVGIRSGADMTAPQSELVALSHTIVAGNYLSFNDVGVAISDYARKTFVLDNEFHEVKRPVLDWGAQTYIQGNKMYFLDERGEHIDPIPDAIGQRKIGRDVNKR